MEHNPNHLIDYINRKPVNIIEDDETTNTPSNSTSNILKEKRCDIMKDKLKICLDNNHSKNSNYCFNLMTSIVENCDN
tara:strand:- start:392 stop:625 length:234 start_codon:yes stop_codon:yes gene_type:complete